MKDPASFAGYRTPAAILDDVSLSLEDKDMALRNWRGAVERVRQVHMEEILRHDSFLHEIDTALEGLACQVRARQRAGKPALQDQGNRGSQSGSSGEMATIRDE